MKVYLNRRNNITNSPSNKNIINNVNDIQDIDIKSENYPKGKIFKKYH